MPDAGVIELLEREARDGKLRKQSLACGIPQHARTGGVARELKAGAEQRSCGTEARGIGIMWFNRSPVAIERDASLRSANFIVNELPRADDNLMQK